MWKRQKLNASSSSSEVDFVRLCEDIVGKIEEVLNRRKVLNERKCRFLASRLSAGIACIREAVECCEDKLAFVPLLAALYRYCERAEVLVTQCAEEDWCAAAIFQCGNSASFVDIVVHIRAVAMEVLKCAIQYTKSLDSNKLVNLYGKSGECCAFFEAADDEELRTRLEVLASERRNGKFTVFGFFEQVDLTQHLARYLLKKNKLQFEFGVRIPLSSLEDLKGHLWEKDDEPIRTWGESKFLGAGSGASGVCMTSWLGVPCAKKEFHGEASKAIFMKEASIMARLKHPCIVDFVCCGNGEGKGDRFIAMELMEKSLFDLIEEQKGVHFALDVALDIISQIANGVKYLHEQGVAHRDLKPHNVVVKTLRSPYRKDFYCVKLVDFGTCKMEVEVAKSNINSYRGVGTTSYRAPEVHPSAHPEGLGKVEWFKADAYSFAMTCAHVLTLTQPYENLKFLSKLYSEILKGERPILPRVCPKHLVDLLEECWSTNRYERPEFSTIHSTLGKIVSNNMLVNLPNLWIKEEQIKEEGHTSYFTAEDVSLCNEAVSSLKKPIVEHSWGVPHQENLLDEVGEEVECALARFARPKEEGIRTSPKRIQGPDQQNLRLQFRNKLALPLFTGSKVEGEQGSAIHVVLQNADTGHVVATGPEASAKMDIVVLEGDFTADDEENWTQDEFENYVVRERDGKRLLLTGELSVNLKDGVGSLGELTFTDNSSWIRSRKFRLGGRIASGQCEGLRIREAKTEAFTVKRELYKKHYPPTLQDEVWRLDKIGKDGAFHKRLNQAQIMTVEDFLRLVVRDPQRLRNILGNGMSNRMWEGTVEHAKTCVLSGKLHVYYPDEKQNICVIFNNIFQLMGIIVDGSYLSVDSLSDSDKVFVDKLVKVAHKDWKNIVEYGGEALIFVKNHQAKGFDSHTEDPLGGLNFHSQGPSLNHQQARGDSSLGYLHPQA